MLKSNILKSLRTVQRPLTATSRLSSSINTKEKYTERQEKLGRPVSPHVGIYKFPPAALSSITNRITGVGLSVGFLGAAVASLGGVDVGVGMSLIGDSCVGALAKFTVAFPFVYHYLGGIRHILWDRSPDMLTSEQVTQSSYVLIGAASAVSVGLAFVSL